MRQAFQRYLNYFLIGVLSLIPFVIVIQIVVYVEQLLRGLVLTIHARSENIWMTVLLFVVAITFVTLFGYRVRKGKTLALTLAESYLLKVPLLSTVYRISKKILDMFKSEGGAARREVVYLEYPDKGLWVPAYVMNRVKDTLVLYVPTSPNPTSGFTIMVKESKVMKSSMSIEEASSFIISVGVDLPKPDEAARLP